MPRSVVVTLIAVLALVAPAASDGTETRSSLASAPPLRVERGIRLEGLASRSIYALVQDQRGFIWVGHESGIDRYDGVRVRHYRLAGNSLQTQQIVFAAVLDRSGNLFAAGRLGKLNRYDRASDSFQPVTPAPSALEQRDVLSLLAAHDGTIWLGTGDGLVRFDPDSGSSLLYRNGGSNVIFALAEDSLGAIWTGTDVGLFRFDPASGSFSSAPLSDGVETDATPAINGLLFVPGGQLLIGTKVGLQAIDVASGSLLAEVSESWARSSGGGFRDAGSMTLIDDHTLVVNDRGIGIAVVDLAEMTISHIRRDPYGSERVAATQLVPVLLDRSGTLWVGDRLDGLTAYKVRRDPFRLFRNDPADASTLGGNYVRGMAEAGENQVWVCTQFEGVSRLDLVTAKAVRYGRAGDRFPGDGARTVAVDRRGDVWVGIEGTGGLAKLDRASDRFLQTSLLTEAEVTVLEEDSAGTLWVGTATGLFEVPPDRKSARRISGWAIEAIHFDQGGDMWLGIRGGLARVRGGSREITDLSDRLGFDDVSIYVCGLFEFEPGQLWIATKGAGVFRYDIGRDELTRLEPINGIPHPNCYAVLPDGSGRLWMSTDGGLVRYDPRDGSRLVFGPQSGLQGTEFNRQAYLRTANGHLLFGGPDGLNEFDPDEFVVPAWSPPLVVSGVMVNGVEVPAVDDFELSYLESTLSIEFGVIDSPGSATVSYSVKLEGVDGDWVPLGPVSTIAYSKLQPGDYTFMVRGSNGNGSWSELAAPIRFRIAPPWWLTSWALVGFAAVALCAAGGLGLGLRNWLHARNRLREAAAIRERNEYLAQAVEQLRLSEQLALEAAQAKSQFLANMSHEMRTPLNALLGMTSLLLKTDLSRQQNEYANTVNVAGTALRAVIDDVLDLSKIEAGALDLHERSFPVREFTEETVDVIAYRASEKNLDLKLHIDENVPGTVAGDDTRIRQILLNLLDNAVKFTERGSVTLDLSLGLPPGTHEPDRVELRFAVTDTGIGVSPEGMDRLFQNFSQLDNSTSRRFGGTGLGLVISRRLAELMGGTLSASSQVGVGSCLTASIPVRRLPESADAPALKAARSVTHALTRSIRILVVDDNRVNRFVLGQMLATLSDFVLFAESGKAAIEVVRKGEIDVVFLDVHMPEMDGIEASRQILELHLTKRPRIVGLTADVLAETRSRCLAAGFDDVLTKPVDLEQLSALLLGLPPDRPEACDDGTVLDMNLFSRICDVVREGGAESVCKVVEEFLVDSGCLVDEIDAAVQAGAYETAWRAAHTLAGTSSLIGASRLAAAARTAVELLRCAGSMSQASSAASGLRLELEKATVVLRSAIADADEGSQSTLKSHEHREAPDGHSRADTGALHDEGEC